MYAYVHTHALTQPIIQPHSQADKHDLPEVAPVMVTVKAPAVPPPIARPGFYGWKLAACTRTSDITSMIGHLRVWTYRRPVKLESEVAVKPGHQPDKNATSLTGADAMSKVQICIGFILNYCVHQFIISFVCVEIYICMRFLHTRTCTA